MIVSDSERREFARKTARFINDELIKTILKELTEFRDLNKFKKYVEKTDGKQDGWIGGVYDAIAVIEEFFINGKDGDAE